MHCDGGAGGGARATARPGPNGQPRARPRARVARMECSTGGELLTLAGGRVTSREIRQLERHVIDVAVSAAASRGTDPSLGDGERRAGLAAAEAALGERKRLDPRQRISPSRSPPSELRTVGASPAHAPRGRSQRSAPAGCPGAGGILRAARGWRGTLVRRCRTGRCARGRCRCRASSACTRFLTVVRILVSTARWRSSSRRSRSSGGAMYASGKSPVRSRCGERLGVDRVGLHARGGDRLRAQRVREVHVVAALPAAPPATPSRRSPRARRASRAGRRAARGTCHGR